MMREILFRGKRDPRYGMKGVWWYGVPYIDHEGDCIMVTHCSNTVVIPETVGQFTGLYDTTKWESLSELEQQEWLKNHTKDEWNGRRIFEGDIVKFGKYCGYINYNHSSFCVKHDEINNPAIDLITIRSELKVIGNVHDNPELLKNYP